MKTLISFGCLAAVLLLSNCKGPENKPSIRTQHSIERKKPVKEIGYHFTDGKTWGRQHKNDLSFQKIVTAINRADLEHLEKMDSILIPTDSTADLVFYLPFPLSIPLIKDVDKIIFFSYATQSFAAYEKGEIVYAGPTNMGREKDQTPTGLFYTNWKAEKTTSTFNDEWDLKWNFNIENKLGVGWHQYAMPGYPASHSCLRLLEADAVYLYTWANQWELNKDTVLLKGTPVIVFGKYDFKGSKPWLQLVKNPHALDISVKDIEQTVSPYLAQIIAEQQKRNNKQPKE